MKRVLVLDNYDSFTYNLVHELRECGASNIVVCRNDAITIQEAAQFELIVLSPGPGIPSEAGVMSDLIRELAPVRSIFGVCLGHQAIGEVFGATLNNLAVPVHGKATGIRVLSQSDPIFNGLPPRFSVGRYHSWVIDRSSLPDCLETLAVDDDGEIMAIRHREYDVSGVQFHPESILTDHGREMLRRTLEQ